MALYVYWFVLALVLVGVEMATGTFYLLVVAIALAIGGAAAFLGFGLAVQFTLAALSGIAGIVLIRRWKSGNATEKTSQSLDAGQPVKVLTWHDDGTARVFYRGAEWGAELDEKDAGNKDTSHEGTFYIKDIHGSVLVLTKNKTI